MFAEFVTRNEINKNFQLGFDYAHSQVIGYHTDEAQMLDPENWPTINELVDNIVVNGIEELVIKADPTWNHDFLRGITCFAVTLRQEIYFYMTDRRLYDMDYPVVTLVRGDWKD